MAAAAPAQPAPAALRNEAAKPRALGAAAPAAQALAPTPPQRPPALQAWLQAAARAQDDPAWPLDARQRAVLQLLGPAAPLHRLPANGMVSARDSAEAPRTLQWRNAQGQTATLQLNERGARWTEPDGSVWQLLLDDDTRQRLQQAL
jgi:hypothetical protein